MLARASTAPWASGRLWLHRVSGLAGQEYDTLDVKAVEARPSGGHAAFSVGATANRQADRRRVARSGCAAGERRLAVTGGARPAVPSAVRVCSFVPTEPGTVGTGHVLAWQGLAIDVTTAYVRFGPLPIVTAHASADIWCLFFLMSFCLPLGSSQAGVVRGHVWPQYMQHVIATLVSQVSWID